MENRRNLENEERVNEDWGTDSKARWIGGAKCEGNQVPVFKREFRIEKGCRGGRIAVTGVGHFELHLDGEKVDDRVLEPAWTNYDKSVDYSVYRIESLKPGLHSLTMWLGNGMYHVKGLGRHAKFERSFGEIGFLLEARWEYENGMTESLVSDTAWRTRPGPIVFSSVYGGEDYDDRVMEEDWELAGTEPDGRWEPANVLSGNRESAAPAGRLVRKTNPPLCITERLAGVRLAGRDIIYDIGRNISGWFEIRFRGSAGKVLKVTPYEMADENGELSQKFTGFPHYYLFYCRDGRPCCWQPKFTYYGFHLLKLEWLEEDLETPAAEPLCIESVTGLMIGVKTKRAGGFRCSLKLWNQIHTLITNAMECNMKSVFTDCPHREKLGWLEQVHLVGPGLLYNYELAGMYRKVLEDMAEAQTPEGLVPDIAPEYHNFDLEQIHEGFRDSPEWGSACIIAPWYLYDQYGDITFLENNYEMMRRYLGYLQTRISCGLLHHGLGDWCDYGVNPPYAQNTPVPLTASAIYLYDLQLMERIAEILRKPEDCALYRQRRQQTEKAFQREFYDNQTKRYGTGSQTANAMALFLGLVPEEDYCLVRDSLIRDIVLRGYGTTSGDVGFPFVLRALEKTGCHDIVTRMLLQTEAPGYGYQILHGATTLCEEWNGNDPEHPSSSQNHFMLGAAEEWFYQVLAGFRRFHGTEERQPQRIVLKPYFPEELDWLTAWHTFPEGRVTIHWKRQHWGIGLKIILPGNAFGKVILPGEEIALHGGENRIRLNGSL
ncbi:glycoside hydrolase family 78 protein [Acetatifactor muris]|nr:family 78 glycoside hydrolase catalytic domain [Acetatifactor muris]MCR2048009.1 glycoside hydrolase family 78 protein [Acetatifactor muris]